MSEQLKTIKDINKAVENALNYRLEQNFDLAISIYQELIKSQPNNPTFHDELAQTQAQKGIAREAIFNYKRALKLGIKNKFWTYKNLGDALTTEQRLDEAILAYQEAIKLNSNNPHVYDALGQVYSLKQNFTEAIENYKKALKLGITDPIWTYQNLGQALEKANQLAEAISIYQQFLKLDPDNYSIGIKLRKIQKLKEEEEANNDWLKVYEQADELFRQEQWKESIKLYQHSLKLNPNFFWSHYNLGRALSKLKQFEAAIKSYQQAIKIEPEKSYLVYLSLGAVFKEQGELDNTIDTYKRTIEIFPETEKSLAQNISSINVDTSTGQTNGNQIQEPNKAIEQERLFANLDDESYIKYLYETLLGREADPKGLKGNLQALKNNVPRRVVLENLLQTEEFLTRNNQNILEELDNKKFLHVFWELLLDRGCDAEAEQAYLQHLENGLSRVQFISELTKSAEFKERIKKSDILSGKRTKNTGSVWIMGTDRYITQKEWDETLFETLCNEFKTKNQGLQVIPKGKQNVCQSQSVLKYLSSHQKPLVSIITSLYKGRDYIECFLENITSQTIFDASELIIIDANSPEGEFEVVKKYMLQFDNIKYIRTEQVIDIYEAWNIGVESARGKFLTNANLDDLRKYNCLEKQAEALLDNEDIDVVYQDFYYSMTPNLPFELIEQCGYKSQLPEVTRENMLQFNSPHNAPMWRKTLHQSIGLFNTSYKSAGDYELWMRGLLNNCKFLKIEEATVVYYHNPSGISTRSEGRGYTETKEIQAIYKTLFEQDLFSLSSQDYINLCRNQLGLTGNIKQIESNQKSWQKQLLLLDRCFTKKLQNLVKDKFYLPLKDVPIEY